MGDPIVDGYPVVLRLAGRSVLVVGGGPVAARKIDALVGAGARVTVVAPDVVPEIEGRSDVRIERRRYVRGEVAGHRLVVTATGDPEVQQQVFEDGEASGVWVNAADEPERCSVVLPAVARRGPVLVAVSTQGASPALAGHLRDLVAAALPGNVEAVAADLAEQRRTIARSGRSTETVDWADRIADAIRRHAPA